MTAAFAYEWVRIRTIRSTWWLTGLTILFGVGISTLFAWAIDRQFTETGIHEGDLDGLGAGVVTQLAATGEIPSLICFMLAIVGVFAWGHEYRHGMIRASLTALNSRTSLWVAKYVVVGVWVAVAAFVTLVLSGLMGTLFLSDYVTVFDSETWHIIGRQVLYGVILTWIAMAFTAITRSQAFALVAMFIWPLLIEPLIRLFFFLVPGLDEHTELLRFRPFDAGNRMVAVEGDALSTFGSPLSALGGTVIFGGLALVLLVASLALFGKRDA
jgi:ABC-2 type transport system permease protein